MLEKFIKKILLIERYAGESSSAQIEESGRRRLFIIFLLLLIIPMFIFGTIHFTVGLFMRGVVNYVICLVFIIFALVAARSRNPRYLYRVVLSMLILLLAWWISGGAQKGYASIWVMTLPPFAFYLMGKKEGVFWTLGIMIMSAVLLLFPSLSYKGYVYDTLLVQRHLFTMMLIVLFTFSYESMRQRFKKAMDREQEKLLDEKEKLARAKKEADEANSRLNLEIGERVKAEEELRSHRDMLEETVAERTAELRTANEKLAADEVRFRLMTNNITDMIWATDINLRYTFISPSVSRIFGYTVEEALDFTVDQWVTPESMEALLREYTGQLELEKDETADPNRNVTLQVEQIKKNGDIFPVEVTVSFIRDAGGQAIGLVGVTRDISERLKAQEENRKIQEQLAQAQKMEAIGILVGGIAHDFNNILAGIIGSFDILKRLLAGENFVKKDKVDRYLALGMESSLRSSDLIKQLLSISRKHEVTLAPMDIVSSLKHVVEICRNSLPKTVEIDFEPPEHSLVVMGDMVQIEQVLLNLCINASHAMTIMVPGGEGQGGVLKIRAGEVDPGYRMKELFPDIEESEVSWLKIQFEDTGVGMDSETRKRIFEPFFTMKKESGSGLGLSISYNIIRQHGGMIHVYSEPGRGSCFTVYLPMEEGEKAGAERMRGQGEIMKGSGIILVIDDEPILLKIAKGFLEECGYEVITASGGDEGIAVYREMWREIVLVLVDLSMPGKSGIEVFHKLRDIRGDVKVILASGMIDPDSVSSALALGIRAVVHKPYLADELSMKIKKFL